MRNTGAAMRGRVSAPNEGVGLRNVERRLAYYYGDTARLELASNAEGATVAELRLPVEELDDANVAVLSRTTSA